MTMLSEDGRRIVGEVARDHGFSVEAVEAMLHAVAAGHGSQAQFNHPEFGGMGQWSSGGMIMIGDMFNNALAGRVATLASALADVVRNQPMFTVPAQSQTQSGGGGQQQMQGSGQMQGGSFQSQGGGFGQQGQGGGLSLFVAGSGQNDWWPADLGAAGSIGSQNSLRYAYFPAARRLAIDNAGQVSVYDTGDHQISGFGQQQSGDQSITFTSQFGTVRVADLPVVSGAGGPHGGGVSFKVQDDQHYRTSSPAPASASPQATPSSGGSDEIFGLIEKLSDLRAKGILTDAEFETKKAELLSRL